MWEIKFEQKSLAGTDFIAYKNIERNNSSAFHQPLPNFYIIAKVRNMLCVKWYVVCQVICCVSSDM